MSDKAFLNYSLHKGLVEDIKDPLKNGRIKVRIFAYDGTTEDALKTTEQLRWAKVSEDFAGWNKEEKRGYGKFWRPRVGDTVWVICERGDTLQRVVIGSTYRYQNSGDATVPFGFRVMEPFQEDETAPKDPLEEGIDAEEEEAYSDESGEPLHYQIKTPGGHIISINESSEKPQVYIRSHKGHTLCFSDEEDNEFILVQDSHKNYLYFDTDKDDLHIYAKNNIKITSGKDFRLHVGQNLDFHVIGYWHSLVGTMITFQSVTMDILNSVTQAIVASWTWIGGTHKRVGQTQDQSGPHSHN